MKNTLDSSIVKLTNYRSVWGYIHKNKQATIPQIAKSIGLSLPTVTRAIDYGIAEGIINPDGVIGAERGRKAQVYKLNADYMHFLLIYLDSDVLSYRIHDFKSRTIGSGNIPICDEKVLSTLENLVMTSVAGSAHSHDGDSRFGRCLQGCCYGLGGIPIAQPYRCCKEAE